MGTFTEHEGDLFSSGAPVLGHGVNTRGLMGAGIARLFRQRYPSMYVEYQQACRAGALLPGGVWPWHAPGSGPVVLNLASQDLPGANARLDWVQSSVTLGLQHIERLGCHDRLALPAIGCGIGGLRWVDVRDVLVDAAAQSRVNVEVWVLPSR